MKFFSENLKTLRQLYVNQLQRLVSAEQQLQEELPELMEKVTDTQLKQAFQSELQEVAVQLDRLEGMLTETAGNAEPVRCKVLAVLIEEAEEMMKDATDPAVRDVALISLVQRIKHYEIAVYGNLRRFAEILGEITHAEHLDKTLREEWHADQLLVSIADRLIPKAERAA